MGGGGGGGGGGVGCYGFIFNYVFFGGEKA